MPSQTRGQSLHAHKLTPLRAENRFVKLRHQCGRRARPNVRRNEAARAAAAAERPLNCSVIAGTSDAPSVAPNPKVTLSARPTQFCCMRAAARLLCVVLMTLTLILHAQANAGAPSQTKLTPGATASLDAVDVFVKAQMLKQNMPGLAVAIVRNDQLLFMSGYGAAADGKPVTPTTQFRLASLSKSFTAVAVLQLVEAGLVLLDAPVSQYVHELAARGPIAGVTVRQLLNQTSGLADMGYAAGLGRQEKTLAERASNLRSARAVDAPGAAFHYFDPNYQLLARLVETVSEQPFDVYLQERIFTPLGMRSSVSAVTSDSGHQRDSHLGLGHLRVYGMSVECPELSGFLAGSGGVVSTAEDMAQFLIAQTRNGRNAGPVLVNAESIALMHSPPPGIASRYGMGWALSNSEGVKVLEHDGVLSTFYAEMVLLPETGYGFGILVNEYALADSVLAFPVLKNGLIALLSGRSAKTEGMSLPALGVVLATASTILTGLAIWSLTGLRGWAARAARVPIWHALPDVLWALTPAIALFSLPRILALTTGRYFSWEMLARAMPELFILLTLCGAIGTLSGLARIAILLRKSGARMA